MLTIYQSDIFEVCLARRSVDLVITSPPRHILKDYIEQLLRWIDWCISPEGVVVIDSPGLYNDQNQRLHRFNNNLLENKELSLEYRYCLALYDLYQVGEMMGVYFYSAQAIDPIKEIPYRKSNERVMQHRCEFDEVYVQSLIERFSDCGDTVLDPFCGTGTVPRIAHKLKREAIGIDKRCPFTNEI